MSPLSNPKFIAYQIGLQMRISHSNEIYRPIIEWYVDEHYTRPKRNLYFLKKCESEILRLYGIRVKIYSGPNHKTRIDIYERSAMEILTEKFNMTFAAIGQAAKKISDNIQVVYDAIQNGDVRTGIQDGSAGGDEA